MLSSVQSMFRKNWLQDWDMRSFRFRKSSCGIDIGDQKIFIDADVNGDGKIGIGEVVYILQKVAGQR